MTDQPSARAPLRPLDRRFLFRLAVGMVVPLAIVAAAVAPQLGGPGFAASALGRLPPLRLHAPELGRVLAAPPAVQIHVAAVAVALAVGLVLLAGVKGTTLHRTLGWSWVVAMGTAALSSFFIRIVNHGAFSLIHLLSGWTVIALPMAVAAARRHEVRAHARGMTGLFTGGLLLAGALAFLPGRLMWRVFFG